MPRNMSFAHTIEPIRRRRKTVTRRKGWAELKPGDLFWAVEKVRGLKKGEKVKRLVLLRCRSNRPVHLNDSSLDMPDVRREGFPSMTPNEFVTMFCKHMGGKPNQPVNRIEFEYVEKT